MAMCTPHLVTHAPLLTHTLLETPLGTHSMDTPYGQQAGGMHPAGMLSYMVKFLPKTA